MGKKKVHHVTEREVIKLISMGNSDIGISRAIPTVSNHTVARIRKSNSEIIEARKREYIKLIDKTTGGDRQQAVTLNQALTAESDIFNFKGQVVGHRPDHKIRLDTIKYIDKLKGREQSPQHLTQNNILISKELDKYR